MKDEQQEQRRRQVQNRQQGQSRKRGTKRGFGRKKTGGGLRVLFLLATVVLAAAAVMVCLHFMEKNSKKEDKRDSAAAVETQFFPGDSSKERALTSDANQEAALKEGGEEESRGDDGGTEEPPAPEKKESAESLLERMTLEEKVLQLFIITPEALTGVDEVYAAGAKTKEAIEAYPVGGLVYFRQNLKDASQVKDMLTRTKQYVRERIGTEPFLSVDEEGGQVSRISGREEFKIPAFPDMSEIGAQGDPKDAYEVGRTIGAYLSEYGFNLDFAPVADVRNNPENTVVARRAFGSDGAVTAAFSNEVVKGLREQGVEAVLKHFPGHGGTSGDSHNGYAETRRTLEEMRADEFVPFREGIEAGARFVMVGHIAAPEVTGDETPATFSKKIVTEILREELGFDGIIITDALNMGAVTASYSSAEAAVEALKAGNDMLLMPKDFKAAYEGVLAAVKNGSLSEARIDESVRRILEVKQGR